MTRPNDTRMHDVTDETRAIVDLVLDYSRARLLSEDTPLDKPLPPAELTRLAGRTIDERGIGATKALGILGMEKAKAVEFAERKIAGTGWLPAPVRIALTAEQERERMVEASGDDDGVCPFDIDDKPVTDSATFPEAAE